MSRLTNLFGDYTDTLEDAEKCVEIAEEFAVGFAWWIKYEKYHIDIERNLWRKYITFPCKTTDELLELYKQSLKQSDNGK